MSRQGLADRRSPSLTRRRREAATVPAAFTALDRVRRLVREKIARDRSIAVIGKAEPEWLRLEGRQTVQFPQLADGSYPGYPPGDSAAAIAHLEAIRANGADVLMVPAHSEWWLSHYGSFAQHLQRRYDLIASEAGVCLLFGLRRGERVSGPALLVEDALLEADERLQRSAAVLDWGTGLDLAQRRDSRFVLKLSTTPGSLPYLDDSIDIVVVDRSCAPAMAKEARRIASAALLVVDATANRDRGGVEIEWKVAATAAPAASPLIESADAAGVGITAAALQKRLRSEGSAHALLVPARATLLPGAIEALLRTLQACADAAIVTGKVFYRDGRLQSAGGIVLANGETVRFGDGEFTPGAPIFSFRRDVDVAPVGLVAIRRAMLEQLGGFDSRYERSEWAIADLCFRARARGWRTVFTPEAQLVLDIDPPAQGKSKRATHRDATEFRTQWQQELSGRAPALSRYGQSFWLAQAWLRRSEGARA